MLETYGQLIGEYGVQILRVAAIAHAEDVRWKVDGFDDFLGEGILEEISDLQQLQTLTIPSPTFKREVTKFLVRRAGKSYGLDAKAVTKAIEELDQAEPGAFEPPQPQVGQGV